MKLSEIKYPKENHFTLFLSEDKKIVIYCGDIVHGCFRVISEAFRDSPKLENFGIFSYGGRYSEALKISGLVRRNKLRTFVFRECCSSASLVFCSGVHRTIHKGARLGFHETHSPSGPEFKQTPGRKIEKALISFGVDRTFYLQANSVPSKEMWCPIREELKERGVVHFIADFDMDEASTYDVLASGKADPIELGVECLSKEDWQGAFNCLVPIAKGGMAFAQFSVGHMYANGNGVEQDYSSAAAWYRKAALQNYAPAANNLGILYSKGLGLKQDEKQALFWISRATELGDPEGKANLARRLNVRPNAQQPKNTWLSRLFKFFAP